MISIITPSVRPELLNIVSRCLLWQTYRDFEWIVASPKKLSVDIDRNIGHEDTLYRFVSEPKKKEGTYYSINAAWNEGIRHSDGELFVSIVDGLWFPPDTLQKLWDHYKRDRMACIGGVGQQYDRMENGKPEHLVWSDPRVRSDTTFYQIPPYDLELCIASLPMKGVRAVGGFDEEYDLAPAWSEKELACRMVKAGYTCYIDQSIEYRAIHHPRLNEEWDKKYPESVARFQEHYAQIQNGTRKKISYV